MGILLYMQDYVNSLVALGTKYFNSQLEERGKGGLYWKLG